MKIKEYYYLKEVIIRQLSHIIGQCHDEDEKSEKLQKK
jgi:pyrroloquinoline quinone (PQQ) biosynthesis protein C